MRSAVEAIVKILSHFASHVPLDKNRLKDFDGRTEKIEKKFSKLNIIGFILSVFMTAAIVFLVVAQPQKGFLVVTGQMVLILALCNLIFLSILAYFAINAFIDIIRIRQNDAGTRIHTRFVTMFSAAAVIPAIIIAISVSVVFQGINNWFSDRVNASVENGAYIAKTYLEAEKKSADEAMSYIVSALKTQSAKDLFQDRISFNIALTNTLKINGTLAGVYIIDEKGVIYARAERDNIPKIRIPPQTNFEDVRNNGPAAYLNPGPDAMRLIYPLEGYGDTVLYGIKLLPQGIVSKLKEANESINHYRDTIQNRERVQTVFALAFFETVLCVLIGAIWMGIFAAENIAVPVARLIQASAKVSKGDLSARVETKNQSEDISVLMHAFNQMTSELQSQQLALKNASLDAENRRKFIETVLSEISAGIVGLDKDAKVSAINKQALVFFDVRIDEILGESLIDLVPEFKEFLSQNTTTHIDDIEIDLNRHQTTRRLRVRGSVLETGGTVITLDDMTRLVNAQRNAAWSDVARRIAHEIKNPLTPIQLSAERLKKKYRPQITQELEIFDRCTETIIRQVGDIGRMVDEFATFARMPAPQFSEQDIGELVRSVVFSQKVAQPDIIISIIDENIDLKAICDGRMIAQALGNVLKNAGEAVLARALQENSDLKTLGGELKITVTKNKEQLTIMVEDNGIGLPQKDRHRLTEPYVTTREKGTGLGLAIVKRIFEDHNGDFYLTDATSLSGACAVMSLPLQTDLSLNSHSVKN